MSIPTDAELAAIAGEVLLTLNETVEIQTPTDTRNSQGEYVKVYATTATVKGRVAPSSYQQAERVVGAAMAAQASWVATLPKGTVVPSDARLRCRGITYDVIGSAAGRSNEMHVRVYAGRTT